MACQNGFQKESRNRCQIECSEYMYGCYFPISRAADVIAILALLSSCCLVAHLESEQFSKMPWGITRSKVVILFVCGCVIVCVIEVTDVSVCDAIASLNIHTPSQTLYFQKT